MKCFPKGARVVFIGDSLTSGGTWVSHVYDQYLRNDPHCGIRMYNCGISGGCTTSAIDSLEENGWFYRPTHAVILLGINDVGRHLYRLPDGKEAFEDLRLEERLQRLSDYSHGMDALVSMLQGRGVHVTILSPSVFNESQDPTHLREIGIDAACEYMAEQNRRLAMRKGCEYMNLHAVMRYLLTMRNIARPDRVHLEPDGQILLAKLFLAEQGMLPAPDLSTPASAMAFLDGAKEECNPLLRKNQARHAAAYALRRVGDASYLIARHAGNASDAEKMAYVKKFRETAQDFWADLADRYIAGYPRKQEMLQDVIRLTDACAIPDSEIQESLQENPENMH